MAQSASWDAQVAKAIRAGSSSVTGIAIVSSEIFAIVQTLCRNGQPPAGWAAHASTHSPYNQDLGQYVQAAYATISDDGDIDMANAVPCGGLALTRRIRKRGKIYIVDVQVFWEYSLFPDRIGNFVAKSMADCNGA
jgi:hypothetical protein